MSVDEAWERLRLLLSPRMRSPQYSTHDAAELEAAVRDLVLQVHDRACPRCETRTAHNQPLTGCYERARLEAMGKEALK